MEKRLLILFLKWISSLITGKINILRRYKFHNSYDRISTLSSILKTVDWVYKRPAKSTSFRPSLNVSFRLYLKRNVKYVKLLILTIFIITPFTIRSRTEQLVDKGRILESFLFQDVFPKQQYYNLKRLKGNWRNLVRRIDP